MRGRETGADTNQGKKKELDNNEKVKKRKREKHERESQLPANKG